MSPGFGWPAPSSIEEFAERDAAFGLEANVDDDKVVFEGDDGGRDDAAFDHAALAEAFVKQCSEIVAGRGVEGSGLVQPCVFKLQQVRADRLAPAVSAPPWGRPIWLERGRKRKSAWGLAPGRSNAAKLCWQNGLQRRPL